MKTLLTRAATLTFAAFAWTSLASAQAYPSKPITWLIPFSAGGPTDVLARAVAPKLSEALGVTVIVENRPGAGGGTAMVALAKAKPDGYTIGMGHTGTHAINPHLYKSLPYDPVKDFQPITPLVSYVNVLVVNPGLPVKTVAELVALAKSDPQRVTFASGGLGTTNHLSGEVLKALTGAPMTHIPYKGSGPALIDVMGGNVSCMFDILVTSLPQIRADKVRALAVTSAKRSPHAPDIPTMKEAGIEGYDQAGSGLWFGVFAPAGVPDTIVNRLNAELVKAMKTPQVQEQMRLQAYDEWTLSPAEYAAQLRADIAKWEPIVKASGAKLE